MGRHHYKENKEEKLKIKKNFGLVMVLDLSIILGVEVYAFNLGFK